MITFKKVPSINDIRGFGVNADSYEVCVRGDFVIGYLYQEVDGFYYFLQAESTGSLWSSHIMKEIAFKLEALNAAWEAKLDEALRELKNRKNEATPPPTQD